MFGESNSVEKLHVELNKRCWIRMSLKSAGIKSAEYSLFLVYTFHNLELSLNDYKMLLS